mgnify:CR=1 FL=1
MWKNRDYKEYEMAYIDIEKYMNSGTKNNDMEVICALYWHWAIQIESQSNISIKEYGLNNSWTGSSNEDDYGVIIEKISEGIPLVVSFSLGSDGGHAINAMRVLRDTEKPNVFYLECYDNNDKNTPYLFKIEQSDMDFWSKTSASNWDNNYSVRPYILKNGKWENVSLSFGEVKN